MSKLHLSVSSTDEVDELWLGSYSDPYSFDTVEIHYCPMCGRKLGD